MSKINPAAVATMTGRELDAAVHERLFGRSLVTTVGIDAAGIEFREYRTPELYDQIPHYSTNFAALKDMIEAVRAKGWGWEAQHSGRRVWLSKGWEQVLGEGDTLPLAFARAAVLTTIREGVTDAE